ncbi:maestro heat-like repeat family member 5 [Ciconia maguari]
MAGRPPGHLRRAWEEDGAAPAPSSGLKPNEMCKVQPLRADLCLSALALSREEENTLDIIRTFLRRRSKQEAEKLRFLASICTVCSTTSVDSTMWDMLYFCQLEVVEAIEVLLQEEPTDHLGTALRQQAMLAITSMSRAGLLLQEKSSSLLHTCFCSIFHLPPQEDTRG